MKEISEDIGEQVISQMKNLLLLLENKFNKNGNEFTPTCNNGNEVLQQA